MVVGCGSTQAQELGKIEFAKLLELVRNIKFHLPTLPKTTSHPTPPILTQQLSVLVCTKHNGRCECFLYLRWRI